MAGVVDDIRRRETPRVDPMTHGSRQGRLGHQLQQEIALIVQRELKDPRLGFVTITRVELSRDLSHAKVGFSCLGGAQERQHSQEALDSACGFIRGLVTKRLPLRIIPEIVFHYDDTIAHAIELEKALDRLKAQDRG